RPHRRIHGRPGPGTGTPETTAFYFFSSPVTLSPSSGVSLLGQAFMAPETPETWYRRYGPLVLRRCRQLLRDAEEAEDALQEVFMQILRRPDLTGAEFPSSLLYKIATHTCLNRLRTRAR